MTPTRAGALALLVVLGAAACQRSTPAAPPPLPAISEPLEAPYVFTARKGGHTLTLFGTLRVGAEPSAIPRWVLDRLDQAPAVAIEPNLSEPLTLMALRRGDGRTLDAELGAASWAAFATAVGDRTATELRALPVAAAARVLEFRGFAMTRTMAPFLLERAQQAKKPIVALEDPAVARALDDRWIDARLVRGMLEQPELARTHTGRMIHGYALADDDELVRASKDDALWTKVGRTDFAQYRKEVLLDRTGAWIAPLDAMVAAGDGFVAVDVERLVGAGSLPERLTQAGYTVARVAAP